MGSPEEKRSGNSEPDGLGTHKRARSGWRKLLPDNPWAIIGPIIAALTVAGVTAAVKVLTSSEPAGELQGFEPVVANPINKYKGVPAPSNPALTASRQTDDSKPRIEVRLQNTGNRRSVLTSAILTVRKEVTVTPCGLGAGLVVSATYDVLLPNRAVEGQTVEVPINQQLGPDEADRFAFSLGLEDPAKDFGRTLVYQLDVAVRHDNSDKPVDLGRVVVALPGTPPPQYTLPQDIANPQQKCEKDVLDKLRQVQQLDGVRSPELQNLLAAAQA